MVINNANYPTLASDVESARVPVTVRPAPTRFTGVVVPKSATAQSGVVVRGHMDSFYAGRL